MIGGDLTGESLEILTHLQQGVHDRHEERLETRDGTSLPDFCLRD